MVYSRESIKMIRRKNQYGNFCPLDCDKCKAQFIGCPIQEEIERLKKPMNYCEFRKWHWGEERYDMGACGIASSGETCYSLYPESEDDPAPRFAAYYIHLKEVELNNE